MTRSPGRSPGCAKQPAERAAFHLELKDKRHYNDNADNYANNQVEPDEAVFMFADPLGYLAKEFFDEAPNLSQPASYVPVVS